MRNLSDIQGCRAREIRSEVTELSLCEVNRVIIMVPKPIFSLNNNFVFMSNHRILWDFKFT